MSSQPYSYKEALAKIEEIVNTIENEEPDVDELSEMVHNALTLIKTCKNKLKNTEAALDKALKELD